MVACWQAVASYRTGCHKRQYRTVRERHVLRKYGAFGRAMYRRNIYSKYKRRPRKQHPGNGLLFINGWPSGWIWKCAEFQRQRLPCVLGGRNAACASDGACGYSQLRKRLRRRSWNGCTFLLASARVADREHHVATSRLKLYARNGMPVWTAPRRNSKISGVAVESNG